jgi:hypothetical protein
MYEPQGMYEYIPTACIQYHVLPMQDEPVENKLFEATLLA